MINPIKPNI